MPMDFGCYRFIERGTIGGMEWLRSRSAVPRGLVLVPPLIGGHALQQLRRLRSLVRRDLDLLSFSYAGHGASNGEFSLHASVNNCIAALHLALAQSRDAGLPLFGIASCFAAIPMLHAVFKSGEPLAKIALINALPNLHWEKMVIEFYRYWRRNRRSRRSSKSFKVALKNYRNELLPNVPHDYQAFGILSRHRVQWPRIIQELFTFRHLDIKPLTSTPVLCVYGRYDRLLQQIGFADWSGYEAQIERICPRTRFFRINGDHFLKDADIRRMVIERVERFFVP